MYFDDKKNLAHVNLNCPKNLIFPRAILVTFEINILTSSVNFINILCTAFALIDPESVKNTVKSSVFFYAFGIYERKSCT